ncbi:MAG: hypothetical protein RLZZ387_4908 [Chloroflexota bacterium]|jgi:hypothetical protein
MLDDPVMALIRSTWADELSAHLGRPADAIRTEGLRAGDFPARGALVLRFPDGSMCRFRYAFHLAGPARRQICVFTEHCGYHVFPDYEVEVTREA